MNPVYSGLFKADKETAIYYIEYGRKGVKIPVVRIRQED